VKIFSAVILSGAAAVLATSAFAQAPTAAQAPAAAVEKTGKHEHHAWHHKGPSLARLDANMDGAIDLAEFANMDRLKKADANGDGTLSQEEITAMVQKAMIERKVDRATRRLDINGDGTVTLAEIEKQKAKRFAIMDRNDDGKIEKAELRPWKRGMEHKAD
jgi:hypothetical protein